MEESEIIDVPLSLVAPAKLNKDASAGSCGLFFPYGTGLKLGLSVDWEGKTHLIHLDGPYLYKEAGIEMGHSIRGAVINEIQYRVDLASRYNAGEQWDPAGALVIRNGLLELFCTKLGDQFHDEPHPVPLGAGSRSGAAEEACGFKRWSIAIRDGEDLKVVRSFEALPAR
jgi:hypothetical protein